MLFLIHSPASFCHLRLSLCQIQLDDLVGDEDFTAAAKLQAAIRALEDQDAMAAVFTELKAAVEEERYSDAKHLRDDAGAGLVGWWAGLDESGAADPFGRLVHVSQQHGKLLAKSYTAKQLSVAGQGIPIFEVYVARNAANPKRYDRQVVYLHHETATLQAKGASTATTSPAPSTSPSTSSSGTDAAPPTSSPSSLAASTSAPSSTPSSSVQRVQDAVSFSWGKKQAADDGKAGDAGARAGAGEKGGSSASQSPPDPASGQASPSPVPPTPPPSPSAASSPPSSPSSASSPASSLPPGADDSLSRVLDFFRERLPDVKLRVFPVVSPADVAAPDGSGAAGTADIPRIVEDVVKRIARDRESAAAAAAGEAAASAAGGEGGKEGDSGSDSGAGDGVGKAKGPLQADSTKDESGGVVPSRGDKSDSGEGESGVPAPRSGTSGAGGGDSEVGEVGDAAVQPPQAEGAGAGSRDGGADDPRRASQLPERDLRRLRAFRERNGMSGEGTGGSRSSSGGESESSNSSSRGEIGGEEISVGVDREGLSGSYGPSRGSREGGGGGGGEGEGGAERSDGEDGSEDAEGRQGIAVRVVVGGVFPGDGAGESVSKVPARIEWRGKDAFVLTVEDSEGDGDAASSSSGSTGASATDPAASQSGPSSSPSSSQSAAVATAVSERLASAATRAAANLMPEDVAKQLWGVDRFSGPEVFKDKDVAQLIRTAVQHVQRRRYTLPRTTAFTRIHAADASTDPFAGLYVGAYGPYTSEAIQVRRRFGTWEEGEEQESETGEAGKVSGRRKGQGERALVPPFEYVEGVKLTGDFNVPAGKVSFRAKIGRHWQMPFRGVYPDELGVVARYPGQGQLAEPGFKNPRWVDGELLVFDGKGSRHTNGAELGFVFSLPERHFLILFNRLKLQS
ncbi:unnamed protein product [Closterium sp. Yama58-4]|nr:unnamed protein product [Closterium sp. Yama58-4]